MQLQVLREPAQDHVMSIESAVGEEGLDQGLLEIHLDLSVLIYVAVQRVVHCCWVSYHLCYL